MKGDKKEFVKSNFYFYEVDKYIYIPISSPQSWEMSLYAISRNSSSEFLTWNYTYAHLVFSQEIPEKV